MGLIFRIYYVYYSYGSQQNTKNKNIIYFLFFYFSLAASWGTVVNVVRWSYIDCILMWHCGEILILNQFSNYLYDKPDNLNSLGRFDKRLSQQQNRSETEKPCRLKKRHHSSKKKSNSNPASTIPIILTVISVLLCFSVFLYITYHSHEQLGLEQQHPKVFITNRVNSIPAPNTVNTWEVVFCINLNEYFELILCMLFPLIKGIYFQLFERDWNLHWANRSYPSVPHSIVRNVSFHSG